MYIYIKGGDQDGSNHVQQNSTVQFKQATLNSGGSRGGGGGGGGGGTRGTCPPPQFFFFGMPLLAAQLARLCLYLRIHIDQLFITDSLIIICTI